MIMNNEAGNVAPSVPVLPEIPPRPCYAQCVNLHLMPAWQREQLGVAYRNYYIIVRYEQSPTPNHLGAWVKLLNPKTKQVSEWCEAYYFIIQTAVWPN